MKYYLPKIDLSSHQYLYCGKEKRKATATDIIYVDDNTYLVTSLLGRKLYLMKIINDSFEIIDEVNTDGYVDLMEYRNGVLITSNAWYNNIDSGASIFNIKDNKITPIKTIKIPKLRLHGCLFIDDDRVILGSNDERTPGLYFLNLKTEEIYKTIKFDLRVKDLCFYNEKLLVVASKTSPSVGTVNVTESTLYIYNFQTMELINKLTFKGQCDAFKMVGDDGFITLQCEHSVAHIKIQNDKMRLC